MKCYIHTITGPITELSGEEMTALIEAIGEVGKQAIEFGDPDTLDKGRWYLDLQEKLRQAQKG